MPKYIAKSFSTFESFVPVKQEDLEEGEEFEEGKTEKKRDYVKYLPTL